MKFHFIFFFLGGGGGGRVRGWGGPGRCERRSEVFVKIRKKKYFFFFFLGGVGGSGHGGAWRGRVGGSGKM